MDNPKVVNRTTVGTTLEHKQGRMTFMRFAIVMMLAASLALFGCSGDDESPGEVVDEDFVITSANQIALVGLTFDGGGSQFGVPQYEFVAITFVMGAGNTVEFNMDEIDEDDNIIGPVVRGGTFTPDNTTGRCTFAGMDVNPPNEAVSDATVNQCTMTVTSNGLCSFGQTCSGELAISADALNDSADVNVRVDSDGDIFVNGVFVGNLND